MAGELSGALAVMGVARVYAEQNGEHVMAENLRQAIVSMAELLKQYERMERAVRLIDKTFQPNGGIGRYSFPANGETAVALLAALWPLQDSALARMGEGA